MAYGNKNSSGYGNRNAAPARTSAPAAAATTFEKTDPIMERFVNTSKSGKAQTLFVGKDGLTIPPNSRIVIAKLTDKQVAGLTRVGKEKGYETVPTHKLMVFAVDSDK